ncbi:hypothetical protein FCL47_12975 [Desulfopila sp. IMCC35006]|uniref:hypothetical protein n=1 Tax=Desulfopila sp. IMCC35006 TaxID=2569542 RepID=UPI0010AC3F89|nr:hypothetical protein [Desulfopila sp. IMCC35006]TKB25453.1 hypothetical protein FCL47_12975 [Desulfopila sp. IMCC35006]
MLAEFFEDNEEMEIYQVYHEHALNRLSEYNIEFDDNEIEQISDCCDPNQIIESNRDRASHDFYSEQNSGGRGASLSEDAAIDDLFDRK